MSLSTSPISYSRLQTSRLKLLPLQSDGFDEYTAQHFEAVEKDKFEVYRWQLGTPATLAEMRVAFQSPEMSPPNVYLFAIVLSETTITRRSKIDPYDVQTFAVAKGSLAGWSAIEYNESMSTAEIGLTIHPEYHNTFVATEVNSLMLHHLLDPQPLDLEVRRVMWKCNVMNLSSRRAAERLGFQLEGVMRYARLMPDRWAFEDLMTSERAPGRSIPTTTSKGEELGTPSHTCIYSICWDDWQGSVREHLDTLAGKYSSL